MNRQMGVLSVSAPPSISNIVCVCVCALHILLKCYCESLTKIKRGENEYMCIIFNIINSMIDATNILSAHMSQEGGLY